MPQAIEAGMTPDQFWYEDVELMHVYFEAYSNRADRLGWIYGSYDRLALVDVVSKVMTKNKNDSFDYPSQPYSAIRANDNGVKAIETKSESDMEKDFREAMLSVY